MERTGLNMETGETLTGWAHCAQSINRCITTRFATRTMRRHLGSLVPALQDQNADPKTILLTYQSIADALNDPDGGEPGFNLKTIDLVEAGRTGRYVFLMTGDYYPLGHLGDYSIREDASLSFSGGVV